jgi:hypothetical protein
MLKFNLNLVKDLKLLVLHLLAFIIDKTIIFYHTISFHHLNHHL